MWKWARHRRCNNVPKTTPPSPLSTPSPRTSNGATSTPKSSPIANTRPSLITSCSKATPTILAKVRLSRLPKVTIKRRWLSVQVSIYSCWGSGNLGRAKQRSLNRWPKKNTISRKSGRKSDWSGIKSIRRMRAVATRSTTFSICCSQKWRIK